MVELVAGYGVNMGLKDVGRSNRSHLNAVGSEMKNGGRSFIL